MPYREDGHLLNLGGFASQHASDTLQDSQWLQTVIA